MEARENIPTLFESDTFAKGFKPFDFGFKKVDDAASSCVESGNVLLNPLGFVRLFGDHEIPVEDYPPEDEGFRLNPDGKLALDKLQQLARDGLLELSLEFKKVSDDLAGVKLKAWIPDTEFVSENDIPVDDEIISIGIKKDKLPIFLSEDQIKQVTLSLKESLGGEATE